jgi:hypothetical protein
MMAVVAGLIELPPAWICEIIFAAELASEALCDPPPCRPTTAYKSAYRVPSVSLVHVDSKALSAMFAGSVNSTTVKLYQQALDLQTSVATQELAVVETVQRRAMARSKRDTAAIRTQEAAFQRLTAQVATTKKQATTAWEAFLAHAKQAKLTDKQSVDPAQQLERLQSVGFSPERVRLMGRLGMSASDIEMVKQMTSDTAGVHPPAKFLDAIPLMIQLNGHNEDITSCSCQATPAK